MFLLTVAYYTDTNNRKSLKMKNNHRFLDGNTLTINTFEGT